jgi:hypothetical protein
VGRFCTRVFHEDTHAENATFQKQLQSHSTIKSAKIAKNETVKDKPPKIGGGGFSQRLPETREMSLEEKPRPKIA